MARILIYGAGAVGQFIGALLVRTNKHKVTMVGRYDHYNEIKLRGLNLKRKKGSDYFKNLDFVPSIERVSREEPFDWIFLTLKAYLLSSALKELATFIDKKNRFLLFQMGIGSHENVTKIIPEDRVFLATMTVNVAIIQPGTVVETNKNGALCLAPVVLRNNMDDLMGLFSGAAIETKSFEDWKPMKWSALMYEMLLNGQCALVDYTPDKVASNSGLLKIEIEAFKEGLKVAKAIGVDLMDLPGYPVKKLISFSNFPEFIQMPLFKSTLIQKDSVKVPTLKNDMDKGKKGTEIGFINGAISRWGKERGVPTPVNDFFTEELIKIVTGKKLWDVYRKKPEEIFSCLHFFRLNYVR